MSIDRFVAQALAAADESTRQLWSEILQAFDNGGPNEVKQLIQTKVRESRRNRMVSVWKTRISDL